MAKRKVALKIGRIVEQGGLDPLTGEPLATQDLSLLDTDRIQQKNDNGTYTDANTRVVAPRAHMARHGTLRDRTTILEHLKSVFDDRVQVMKLSLKINNQLLAYKRRTDHPHPETLAFLTQQLTPIKDRLKEIDALLHALVDEMSHTDPLVKAAMGVKYLGAVTVAALTVYVDLGGRFPELDGDDKPHPRAGQEKAGTASSLWKYVGLHAASHERYQKGTAGGGNKTLRTVMWNSASSFMKGKGPYRDLYVRVKTRLAASQHEVQTRNTAGKLVTATWATTKACHRDGAALRAVMKAVLADYWFVGRSILGLPTRPLYVVEKLGHEKVVQPEERGWVWTPGTPSTIE